MATASRLTSYMEDVTKCSICLEDYEDPRSLTCLHTFCLKCIKGHCKDDQPGDEAVCPICRYVFVIPDNGVQGLRHNFFVDDLLQAKNLPGKTSDGLPCEVCGDEGGKATKYCVDCQQKLCDGCSKPHLKIIRGGAHQVLQLGEELGQHVKIRRNVCEEHSEEIKMFCCDCQLNICTVCFAVSHQLHKCQEIRKASEAVTKQIMSDVDAIQTEIGKVKRGSTRLARQKKLTVEKIQSTVVSIKKKGEEIKEMVDRQVSEMLDQLQQVEVTIEKDTMTVQDNIELHLVALESYVNYANEVGSKGSPCDVTRVAGQLHQRAVELQKKEEPNIECCFPDINFSPRGISDGNMIGDLVIRDNKTTAPIQGHSEHVWTFKLNENAKGVAVNDSAIFISCDSPPRIRTFAADTFQPLSDIVIREMSKPVDMAVCHLTKNLFVAGWETRVNETTSIRSQCIWRVSILNHNQRPTSYEKWLPTSGISSVRSLSVTRSLLLMTPSIDKLPYSLTQYDSNRCKIRDVTLPKYMNNVYHAVATASDDVYLVCHRGTSSGNKQCAVSEVTERGEVRRQFISSFSSPSYSGYLSTVNDTIDEVFLAQGDMPIWDIMLISGLKEEKVVLDSSQIQVPSKLCHHNRRLYVVHGSMYPPRNLVSVFKIR